MTTREEVYVAIDSEREYQINRWKKPASKVDHSIEEWLVYIEDYINEAKHILSRKDDVVARAEALPIMRKIAAMAVTAMEQHGAPLR
jgi:hypothetical protein